ncbi:hypothetical protein CDD80_807 [Ophiocordyceps camponoti-rufipedis]|uniref:Uncharacterized protein n=1 Tax=Ophiocordyceps camponoti-rufipedis TaxID=2004952 RepID=A0A2C5YD96_9HYPO|nr:hypothetical protein CDD80_807 [Ophiocordyceps camponoti-rufipedis]
MQPTKPAELRITIIITIHCSTHNKAMIDTSSAAGIAASRQKSCNACVRGKRSARPRLRLLSPASHDGVIVRIRGQSGRAGAEFGVAAGRLAGGLAGGS